MDYTYHYQSPLGDITLASNGKALIGLWFDKQKYFADTLEKNSIEQDLPIFAATQRWLDTYFSGCAPDFTPPLSIKTTPFRQAVWKIMLQIPYKKSDIKWNFTKFLINKNGEVMERFEPTADMKEIEEKVAELL